MTDQGIDTAIDQQHSALVTGAAGFIGSHLVASLVDAGWFVVAVDNFDNFYDRATKERNLDRIGRDRFVFHDIDIRDEAAVKAVMPPDGTRRTLFHFAALAGVRPSLQRPRDFTSVNVDGLVSVLEAARSSGVNDVVFASSSSVYGNNHKVPFAEDDPVAAPISPYAATKRAGELLCHTYAHLFEMKIACLRLFTVYGPAQRPDLAIMKFMQLISDGVPLPMFGDGSTSRDYTFIDDLIQGVQAAGAFVQNSEPGTCQIFNLGSDAPITLRGLIDAIAHTVGREAIIEQHPMQPGDVNQTWADLTRSRDVLGYAPVTPLATGLAAQWSWYQTVLTTASR